MTKPSTNGGKPPAPPLEAALPDALTALPYTLATSSAYLYREQGADEIIILTGGAAQLVTTHHNLQLDYGDWLLVRWHTEPDSDTDHPRLVRVTLTPAASP